MYHMHTYQVEDPQKSVDSIEMWLQHILSVHLCVCVCVCVCVYYTHLCTYTYVYTSTQAVKSHIINVHTPLLTLLCMQAKGLNFVHLIMYLYIRTCT